MSKRLTRKQIKEDIRHDDFQTAVETTYEQFREHQNLLIGIGVAIVVAAIGFSLTRNYLVSRDDAANYALGKAVTIYNAPIVEEGAKPDDREPSFASEDERRSRAQSAIEEVKGGAAEEVAGLLLADMALENGDTSAARGHWEEFLAAHQDHLLAAAVRLNLIRLDREEGKAAEVADRLQAELENSTSQTLPEDVLLFELAEALDDLDRGEEAEEYYQRILDDHPQSPYAAPARQKTSNS